MRCCRSRYLRCARRPLGYGCCAGGCRRGRCVRCIRQGRPKETDTLAVAPVNMKLSDLLDTASAAWAIKYRFADDGAIELYRTKTRILRVKAMAQTLKHSDTQSTGFNAESKTVFDSPATDVLAGMRASLMALGTNAGTVDINVDSKAVIVTDTPEAIARMEAYIEAENKHLTRSVKLMVETLVVYSKHEREAGVNWTAVYQQLDGLVSASSPATLTSTNAGTMGFTPSASSAKGSSLLISALEEMGLGATQRSFHRTPSLGIPLPLATRPRLITCSRSRRIR